MENSAPIVFKPRRLRDIRRLRRLNLATCAMPKLWQAFLGEIQVAHTNLELQHALVIRYSSYAKKIANSYFYRRMPRYSLASHGDLQQAAYLGLCEAINRYRFGHGTTFEQYATPRVFGSIIDCLRDYQDFPRVIAHIRRSYRFDIIHLYHQLKRKPTLQDIYDHLGPVAHINLSDPLVASGVFNQCLAEETGDLLINTVIDKKHGKKTHATSLEIEDRLLGIFQDDDVRFAVYASFWLGWKLEKIARHLNCSPSTVHNRIQEGKEIIRTQIPEEEIFDMLS